MFIRHELAALALLTASACSPNPRVGIKPPTSNNPSELKQALIQPPAVKSSPEELIYDKKDRLDNFLKSARLPDGRLFSQAVNYQVRIVDPQGKSLRAEVLTPLLRTRTLPYIDDRLILPEMYHYSQLAIIHWDLEVVIRNDVFVAHFRRPQPREKVSPWTFNGKVVGGQNYLRIL